MVTIEQLKARLVELSETGKAIQAKADAEKRDLAVDEQNEIERVFAEFDQVENDIKRRERFTANEARLGEPTGRMVPPQPTAAQATNVEPVTGMRNSRLPTLEERQRWGFRDFGEYCMSVKNAALSPGKTDPRLIQAAATTYGTEGIGSDGGYAVPPEWPSEIMSVVAAENSLLSMTDQQTASGYSITFPADETTAWQTTGGILAYFALQTMQQWIPTLLALAAASMLYVSVADLIPGLHRRPELQATLQQVILISLGVATIWMVEELAHTQA